MSSKLSNLSKADVLHQFHPYTDARLHEEVGPLVITRGEGVYVFDELGRRYLEAMSGLWSVGLGFSNERLIRAAEAQLRTLPFYHLFSHKSHVSSIQLAEKLIELAPVPMSKVFFTNSGSEANDTIVKLIWYRSNAAGKPAKKKIISRAGGYHGVTVVSASLTGLQGIHRGFDLPLPGFLHVSYPHLYRFGLPGETEEAYADRLAAELEDLIQKEGPETIAAFYGEPLMGAGGVIVPPRTYWEKIQKVCQRHDILIVADEIICGFGRTGNMFGCETFDIKPDIMVVSKQLSSSYQPIAAVLINDRVFQPIAEQSHDFGGFGHGLTGGGHPVACAVSLENIRVIEDENLVEHARHMGHRLHTALTSMTDHPLIGEVRGCGLVAGVELVIDKAEKTALPEKGKLGREFITRAHSNGIIFRGIYDTIAICPPLISTSSEIDELIEKFGRTLDDVSRALG
ncbi:aspartate aminotransferase family protein [Paraburkholderia aspalathi]|uniref:4-aminobutyrate---pyruvate transaminase n=1 Tax=Paraburkholderia aspalathi TaxID=1324617 RepID=A0A1I7EA26_9BURK|nr:aspartate aminotransferase family protein [Paraburkholderia aspalathi]SFU20800.1 4-aminobutyrate---pyruvate transaminase [Paraburkholderia aspalathi]